MEVSVENWRNNYTYSWAAQRKRARRDFWLDTIALVIAHAAVVALAAYIFIILSS